MAASHPRLAVDCHWPSGGDMALLYYCILPCDALHGGLYVHLHVERITMPWLAAWCCCTCYAAAVQGLIEVKFCMLCLFQLAG